jgi:hypothetical protein
LFSGEHGKLANKRDNICGRTPNIFVLKKILEFVLSKIKTMNSSINVAKLKEIADKNEFTDVTFTVKGTKIAAHKLILSGTIKNYIHH